MVKNRTAGRNDNSALRMWWKPACVALLSLALLACAKDWKPALQSHDELIRAFDETALRGGMVVKWNEPIRYAVEEDGMDTRRMAFAEAALLRMAGIAGVTAFKVPHVSAANLILTFGNTDNYKLSSGQTAFCYVTRRSSPGTGAMMTATLYLNSNIPQSFYGSTNPVTPEHCIVHELMHAFGFFGHSHRTYSILSYANIRLQDLSEADELLLRTLYDSRLKSGTPSWPALHQAHAIMAELRQKAYPDQPLPAFPRYIEKRAAELNAR
jgi:hypothetical protein